MSDTEFTHAGYDCLCSQQEAADESKLHLACEDFSNTHE